MNEPLSKAKQQEIINIIESDPELFLNLAQESKIGRRILAAIQRDEHERAMRELAKGANEAPREVSATEAMDALEQLEQSSHYRQDRDAFMAGKRDFNGVVTGNVSLQAFITLTQYARQQVVNEDPSLYVLQDSRSTADNKMLFWAKGALGYTTDLSKAHRFTEAEAKAQHAARETDIPHQVGNLAPATAEMLRYAGEHIERAQKAAKRVNDPLAMPRPTAPSLGRLHAFRPEGSDYYSAVGIRQMFENDKHADDQVLMVADRDTPNLLDTVIVNPHDYQVTAAQEDRQKLVYQCTLAEFASIMWAYPNVHQAMSYNSWEQLSDFLQPHMDKLRVFENNIQRSLTEFLPTDTPPVVARQRLALLDAFAAPENLRAKMLLGDLEMAGLYGEPTNEQLFTDHPLDLNWRALVKAHDIGASAERALEYQDMIDEMRADIQAMAAKGLEVPDKSRFALALLELTTWENEQRMESCMAIHSRDARRHDAYLADKLDLGDDAEPDDQPSMNM